MWMIIAAIIIFIIFSNRESKTSATPNTKTAPPLHCTVHRTGDYSSILNELEQIVFLIAKRCPEKVISVLSDVLSLDETSGISYGKKNQCFHLLCLFPD